MREYLTVDEIIEKFDLRKMTDDELSDELVPREYSMKYQDAVRKVINQRKKDLTCE